MKQIQLGKKVRISDPCYGTKVWCAGTIDNVKEGLYNVEVEYSDEGDWGTRVKSISVFHPEFNWENFSIESTDFEVGVDSGQAGIFDYEYYAKYHMDATEREHVNDAWYDRMCNLTEEYVANPNYVSFLSLPEYKACMMAFRNELNALTEKYPELDVDSAYMEKVNYYNDLEKPIDFNNTLSLDDLLEALRHLKDVLSGDCEEVERTDGEKELANIETKYSMLLHNYYKNHQASRNSHEKIYRSTGNTTDGLGLVSSSGYGDGGYNCWTAKNEDGKIVAIRVEFITEDDYEDEEDYEEE
jgi:hypothetical protein